MQQQKPLAAKRKALVKNTARRALSFAKFKLVTAIEKVRGFLSELQWGIVERNIKNGGNPDARVEGGFGTTYLILAAKTGNEKMVRFLLEHGASTEIRDFRDMTALMHAAAGNSPWSVILLLEHGADPIARDYYFGMTAMDRAKEAGNKRAEMPLAVEMARRLIGTQGWAYFSRNFAECTSPLFQSPAQ